MTLNEALYTFEHSGAYEAMFIIFFIAMIVLILLSIISIYRSRYVEEQQKKLNSVRYIVCWCLIVQFWTFYGYYIRSCTVFCSLWNVWIPSWTIGYIFLSYNVTLLYLPSKSLKKKISKKQLLMWKIIWCLWLGCSLANWIGSLWGWGFIGGRPHPRVQAWGYMLKSLIGLIMLLLMVYILFDIKSVVKETLMITFETTKMETNMSVTAVTSQTKTNSNINDHDNNLKRTKSNNDTYLEDLEHGYKKIKRLIALELLLCWCLFVNVIFESYIIYVYYAHVFFSNPFVESTVLSMIVYWPVWTLFHVVLLAYSWIPKKDMISPAVTKLSNLQKNEEIDPELGDSQMTNTNQMSSQEMEMGSTGERSIEEVQSGTIPQIGTNIHKCNSTSVGSSELDITIAVTPSNVEMNQELR